MSDVCPRVYVLLLNWKGWRDTIECLESAFRLAYPDFRVVVCDNDSPDGSVERIEEWARGELDAEASGGPTHVRGTGPPRRPVACVTLDRQAAETGGGPEDVPLVIVRTGGNLGFAGGNNVGLRYVLARGDAGYVWLLNNDTVVDPEALGALVRVAEADPGLGFVGSKLLYYDAPETVQAVGGGTLVRWNGLTRHVGEGRPDGPGWDALPAPDYITGASMLVRLAMVAEVGGLDERYFLYSEEVDWCLRARRRGWRVATAVASRVWHKAGRSVEYGSPTHDYHVIRSVLLLVSRFHPRLLPAAVLYSLYRCFAPRLVRREFGRAWGLVRAYRDTLAEIASGEPPDPAAGWQARQPRGGEGPRR